MASLTKKLVKMPTIRRFPMYLHILYEMKHKGREVVSSAHLARDMELDQVLVKKDLEVTNLTGKPGVGYQTQELIEVIEEFLGWNNTREAFLVGTGDLGSALLGYGGFRERGLRLVAAFDSDIDKIGKAVHGVEVFPVEKLQNLIRRMHIQIAVLAVPAGEAQKMADMLVESGIKGIWNFTPAKIRVPGDIIVQREDLSAGLAELTVKLKHKKFVNSANEVLETPES